MGSEHERRLKTAGSNPAIAAGVLELAAATAYGSEQ
jgi:hypothetical protein